VSLDGKIWAVNHYAAFASFLRFAHPALIAARCAADNFFPRSLLTRPADGRPLLDIALIAALIWDSFAPTFSDTASSFASSSLLGLFRLPCRAQPRFQVGRTTQNCHHFFRQIGVSLFCLALPVLALARTSE
jgi:hypothetical protein